MDLDEFEAKTVAFISWLSDIGVKINPKAELVDFRLDGRGRGVVAASDFEEDEVVFSIPRKAVLNMQNILPDVNNGPVLNMPSWLSLASLMIVESLRTDSKWAPYFAVLPEQLNSLVFWSEEELAGLQASTVVHKIGKAKADDIFSRQFTPLVLQGCTKDLCHRVASIIMAYAFDIPEKTNTLEGNTGGDEDGEELVSDDEEDEKTLLSMIPLADMLNADADRNNARLCCDNEDLEMRTIKPISTGEEIFNDYGQLPRSDLLRRYGYVTERYAAYDVAEISTESIIQTFRSGGIQIPNLEQLSNEDLNKRVELAEREGVLEDSYDLSRSGEDNPSIPDELLAFLYLLLVDKENFEVISSSQSSLPSRSKLTTELVGQALAMLLKVREMEYATTLEEDQRLVAAGNLPRRTDMAIQVRMGEKQVLKEAIQEATSFEESNKRMRLAKSTEHDAPVQNGKAKRRAEETSHPKKKGRFR